MSDRTWFAAAFGAVDLRGKETQEHDAKCAVLPIFPGMPSLLLGEAGDFWLRLIDQPTPDSNLSPDLQVLVREFEEFGIATTQGDHPARIDSINKPRMVSLQHELVTGLVAAVSDEESLASIVIKGPTMHHQGLRTKEHSGDVDVLVRPRDGSSLIKSLEKWGWMALPGPFSGTRVWHSQALKPPDWGCEIDVHWRMPGYALSDAAGFDVIKKYSEKVEFASRAVCVPEPPMHAVLGALHAMRPEYAKGPTLRQIDVGKGLLQAGGPKSVDCAKELKADLVLGDLLAPLYPALWTTPTYQFPENWTWRLHEGLLRSYIVGLSQVLWFERPYVLFRLLWPKPAYLISKYNISEPTLLKVLAARMKRFRAGWMHVMKMIGSR